MSLLMQALKKAEQAKQKQNDLPNALPIMTEQVKPKEALSVDVELSKDKLESNLESLSEPAFSITTSPAFSELSLTPHQEEVSLEKERTALDDDQQEKQIENQYEEKNNVHVDFSQQESLNKVVQKSDPAIEKIDTNTLPNSSSEENSGQPFQSTVEDHVTEINQNVTYPSREKVQTPLKEKATNQQILDKIIAQSVFDSKTPHSKLRSRWMTIVLIVMLLSLFVAGYLYLQQANQIQNQFPANTPIPTPNPTQTTSSIDAHKTTPEAKIEEVDKTSKEKNNESKTIITEKKIDLNKTSEMGLATSTLPVNANEDKKSNHLKKQENQNTNKNKKIKETGNSAVSIQVPTKSNNKNNDIHISKGVGDTRINPYLTEAYQAYMSGDRRTANLQYQKVLQQEPNNRDALLGLAAIALNARQAEQAGAYYGQLLILDPNDPEAIAGLTSLQQGDPIQSESQLKSALMKHPSAGALLFALGNLYAQQSRWSDAQQTYFRAYTSIPNNADYAFNLAISLDRLNQRKLAIEYYQKAIALGKSGNINFSYVKAQQRLSELESVLEK